MSTVYLYNEKILEEKHGCRCEYDVNQCSAKCHCPHICNNNKHECICRNDNVNWCKSNVDIGGHYCICDILEFKPCLAPHSHKCRCQSFGSKYCKSERHNCPCVKFGSATCLSVSDHYCTCLINPYTCKKIEWGPKTGHHKCCCTKFKDGPLMCKIPQDGKHDCSCKFNHMICKATYLSHNCMCNEFKDGYTICKKNSNHDCICTIKRRNLYCKTNKYKHRYRPTGCGCADEYGDCIIL